MTKSLDLSSLVDVPRYNTHVCAADPDAQSLHDALVQASKSALDEVLNATV